MNTRQIVCQVGEEGQVRFTEGKRGSWSEQTGAKCQQYINNIQHANMKE